MDHGNDLWFIFTIIKLPYNYIFTLTADTNLAPEPTRNMLRYFSSGAINDNSTKIIDTAVTTAREKEEWRQEYMLTFVHDKDVYNDGLAEGKTMLLLAMVKDGEITTESAARRLGITEEEFKKLLNDEKN